MKKITQYNLDILSGKSSKNILSYVLFIHDQIDDNDYQSNAVEESYKSFIVDLHNKAFEVLKEKNASDKELLSFAKILTGRCQIDTIDMPV